MFGPQRPRVAFGDLRSSKCPTRRRIRENSYYYWLRIIREEALRETENRSCALVRVEPEKLAVETVSPQSSSERIVIRTHGVEAEFPPGTDIGMLAAFVKALSHA